MVLIEMDALDRAKQKAKQYQREGGSFHLDSHGKGYLLQGESHLTPIGGMMVRATYSSTAEIVMGSAGVLSLPTETMDELCRLWLQMRAK